MTFLMESPIHKHGIAHGIHVTGSQLHYLTRGFTAKELQEDGGAMTLDLLVTSLIAPSISSRLERALNDLLKSN